MESHLLASFTVHVLQLVVQAVGERKGGLGRGNGVRGEVIER